MVCDARRGTLPEQQRAVVGAAHEIMLRCIERLERACHNGALTQRYDADALIEMRRILDDASEDSAVSEQSEGYAYTQPAPAATGGGETATKTSETSEAGRGTDDQTDPYSMPLTYARDKWIYDNIHKNTSDTLSRKLKTKARKEKWQIISSRNGFKKAADRYADFHSLEERRFRAN